jgi:hypothetical protein
LISTRPSSRAPPASAAASATASSSRIERLNRRLPRFLHRYTTPLANAPLSHVTSFLLLHEITAVAPLLSLAALFHYTSWLPSFLTEGKWASDGMEKFGRWFKKRGWLGEGEGLGEDGGATSEGERKRVWRERGETGARLVVE